MEKIKRNMGLALILAIVILSFVVSHALPARAAEPLKWSIATSSSGGTPEKLGIIISNIMNKNQTYMNLNAQITGGFVENLYLVAEKEVNMAMATATDLFKAYNELDEFKETPEFKNIRRVTLYGIDHGHQFVRADSDIYKMEDLVGRKFNVSTKTSTTYPRCMAMIAGMGYKPEDFQLLEIATSGAADAVRDRIVDCSANGMSIGNSALLELSSTVPIRLLEIPESWFPKFNELMGGTLGHGVIPAGTYNGQDTDVKTWLGYNILYCHTDADEEVVYNFVKYFWDNIGEMNELDYGFKLINRDMAMEGPESVPLHPGAERYFKEIGLLK